MNLHRRPGRPHAGRVHIGRVRVGHVRVGRLGVGRAAAVTAIVLALLTVAGPAFAAGPAAPATLNDVINNIRNWMIGLLASGATLFLTAGGIRYMAANGDPGEISRAKTALKAAAAGYALAVLAPMFLTILKSLVGG